jgi:hypothetical protein
MKRTETSGIVGGFLLLRQVIGWIGTLLPIAMIAGEATFYPSSPLPIDLSSYYYTPMRNILVGSLCVLGIFLMLYEVGLFAERWTTNVAGLGALGVGLFPGLPSASHHTTSEAVVGDIHVGFASLAFVALSVTIWRFARADSDGPGSEPPSHGEAIYYRVSAIVMLVFLALTGVANLIPVSVQKDTLLLFIFEGLSVITFGVSWLVKGRALRPVLSRLQTRSPQPPSATA